MQISSNYSMNGVPYENRCRQKDIPEFSTERAKQENKNINPYMEDTDFNEKAFDMIGPNAPQDVKDAWMEAAKEVNANGLGIKKNGMLSHISQMMVQRLNKQMKGEGDGMFSASVSLLRECPLWLRQTSAWTAKLKELSINYSSFTIS